MKRIIRYWLFTILSFATVLLSANALTTKLTVSSSKVAPNKEFTVSFVTSGLSNGLASADYVLQYDATKMTYVSYKMGQSKPNGDAVINAATKGQINISYMDSTGGTNAATNGTLITITFKTNSNATSGTASFSLSGSGYADKNASAISGSTTGATITFYQPSTNSTLQSLSVDDLQLNPSFDPKTTTYSLGETEKNAIVINATPAEKASVLGTGRKTLKLGENELKVTVTAEDGKTRTVYTIKVTRIDNRSSNNKLSSLKIEGININFDSNNYFYQIELPESTTFLNIDAIPADSKSSISGSGIVEIQDDAKSHIITVTAENGETSSYTIVFTNRSDTQTQITSTELSKLSINDVNINLANHTNNIYLFGVINSINELTIKYETVSQTAAVDISNSDSLTVGINKVTITVSDGNMPKREYIILVHKDASYHKVTTLEDVLANATSENVILELNTASTNTIPKSIIDQLKNNSLKLHVNIVDDYKGLRYSLTIPASEMTDELNLNLTSTNQNPLTLSSSLPAGITVKYFIGDLTTPSLKVYSQNSNTGAILLSDNTNIVDGYITFTTDGSSSYSLTEKEINQTPQEENKSSSWLIYLLLGTAIGIGGTLLVQLAIKHKDKLLPKKKSENQETPITINSVIATQNQPAKNGSSTVLNLDGVVASATPAPAPTETSIQPQENILNLDNVVLTNSQTNEKKVEPTPTIETMFNAPATQPINNQAPVPPISQPASVQALTASVQPLTNQVPTQPVQTPPVGENQTRPVNNQPVEQPPVITPPSQPSTTQVIQEPINTAPQPPSPQVASPTTQTPTQVVNLESKPINQPASNQQLSNSSVTQPTNANSTHEIQLAPSAVLTKQPVIQLDHNTPLPQNVQTATTPARVATSTAQMAPTAAQSTVVNTTTTHTPEKLS